MSNYHANTTCAMKYVICEFDKVHLTIPYFESLCYQNKNTEKCKYPRVTRQNLIFK